jgi:hypothetical protein
MSRRLDIRSLPRRHATLALAILALSTMAVACASPRLPTLTTVTDEKVEDRRTPPSPDAPAAPAPAPEPEEPTIVGDAVGPARAVLETAEQMHEDSTVVRGSCYDYVSAVYDRAGFGSRRAREAVFQGPRRGPYADLDLISPGDWLYIVAYPDARPIGTHSVLFVRWEDRQAGRALVFSYVGGRAERPAHLMSRDVSRTYTVLRAREGR